MGAMNSTTLPAPTSPIRRRGRPARPEAEVRHAVLQATLELLLAQGYEATTIEAVAAHAGVAKKTVYRHASNREELVGLAVREWTDGFAPQLQRDARNAQEVVPLLQDILHAVCTQALSAQAVQVFACWPPISPARTRCCRPTSTTASNAAVRCWPTGWHVSSSVDCCAREIPHAWRG